MPSTGQSTIAAARLHDGVLGRLGGLEVRLARGKDEMAALQALRYGVFTSEFGAQFSADCTAAGRDEDPFDALFDHLVVIDPVRHSAGGPAIVGTYRLRAQPASATAKTFYSQSEFDVAALASRQPSAVFLELGRSCVLPAYRGKRTIELLWQGIWAYARAHGADVMLGCASFGGTVPARHAHALSFLHHHFPAAPDWHVTARPERFVDMDMMPAEAIDMRRALLDLPPLIKGYLRLGGRVGHGAVIDHAFGSIDVMIVLPVVDIDRRYIAHYGENAQRFAA